jgi:hypothetical protein
MTTRELIALAAAFVAGAAVERHRQAQRAQPLRLADTPAAWAHAVRHQVGGAHALAAALAVGTALALLVLPSLSGAPSGDPDPEAPDRSRAAETLPRVEVTRERADRDFTIGGLTLRVFRAFESQGIQALNRPAGRGRKWLHVGVDVRNVGRRRFRPSTIAYRLRDGRGRSYWPDVGGGTGPASLAKSGHLERGAVAATRLRFRVPRRARGFVLVFEPRGASARQVRVPLGG